VDAAHFVSAPFLGVLWCVQRLFVKAPSGRQRFNVLAALHATSHELFTVTNLTYITATTVCELLQGLAGAYPGVPITIVLDNARYQRCALGQTLAATLGIALLYVPPYSPKLNLIERLSWTMPAINAVRSAKPWPQPWASHCSTCPPIPRSLI